MSGFVCLTDLVWFGFGSAQLQVMLLFSVISMNRGGNCKVFPVYKELGANNVYVHMTQACIYLEPQFI